MMRRVLLCGAALLAVTTVACGPDYWTNRIATPARDTRAQHVIHHVVAGERDSFLTLLAMVACLVFSLGTAIFLATRRQMPKRWRWVLASLVGVGMVSVNWTTGEVASRLFSVQLLGASAVRPSEFAPWILSFSFPIGAIVALSRYRSYRDSLKAPNTPEALEQSDAQQAAT